MKNFFAAVLASALVSALAVAVYDRYFAVHLVAVDVKRYLEARREHFVRDFEAKHVQDEDVRRAAAEFSRETVNHIQEYTLGKVRKNEVPLMREMVLGNAKVISVE